MVQVYAHYNNGCRRTYRIKPSYYIRLFFSDPFVFNTHRQLLYVVFVFCSYHILFILDYIIFEKVMNTFRKSLFGRIMKQWSKCRREKVYERKKIQIQHKKVAYAY